MIIVSPFGPKKEPDFYDEQIQRLKEEVCLMEVNSDEWIAGMQNIATLENQKKNQEHRIEAKDVIQAVTGIGGLFVSVLGIAATWETAKMAYVSDEQMKMKNGDVWRISSDYKTYYKSK